MLAEIDDGLSEAMDEVEGQISCWEGVGVEADCKKVGWLEIGCNGAWIFWGEVGGELVDGHEVQVL